MKFAERIARRSGRPFHSGFVTSFAVEYAAVEEILLPQLMASGATNLLLIADERMAALGLQDGLTMPVALGREYALWSPPVADGLFHPKIILQLGRDGGRAFISSANATAAGLAGNAEIACELECGAEPSPEQAIIRSVWSYLDGLVPADPSSARDALEWARARTPWIEDVEQRPIQIRDDGSALAFFAGGRDAAIADQFCATVQDPVEHLMVISPFWDSQLQAIVDLSERLNPQRVSVLIDTLQHDFPASAQSANNFNLIDISQWRPTRFTHAKLIIAVTANNDHVLAGSANCTTAALGRRGHRGSNAEACLYRRLPRGAATANLALDRWLESDPIPPTAIPARGPSPDIPLKELESKRAGYFEIEQGKLSWSAPRNVPPGCVIELLTHDTEMVQEIAADGIEALPTHAFTLTRDSAERAAFALLRADGFVSNLAPVINRSALRSSRREIASGKLAKALSQFAVGGDFGLWLHEALDELIRADVEDEERRRVTSSRPSRQRPDEPVIDHGPLSYDEFMKMRGDTSHGAHARQSSVADLHSDSIRGFLNSLIGVSSRSNERVSSDDSWMNLGDEAAAGATPQAQPGQHSSAEIPGATEVDAAACAQKIGQYVDSLHEPSKSVGPLDVLRLRFVITFLLYCARCPMCPRGLLPSSEDLSWPRLLLRAISAFFVGRNAPIGRLMLAGEYVQIPADVLECWAAVEWALRAIEASVPARPRNREFLVYVPRLREKVRTLLALRPSDLDSEAYRAAWDGLDSTIGHRLGIALS